MTYIKDHIDAPAPHSGHAIPISNQNIVTGSRGLGTIYQNTTGKPIDILITVSIGSTGCDFEIKSDSSPTPSDVISTFHQSSNTHDARHFVVLPNNYYNIAISGGSGGAIIKWVEWN